MLLKSSPKVMWYAADIELDWMFHKVIYPRNDIGTIDIDRLIPTKKDSTSSWYTTDSSIECYLNGKLGRTTSLFRRWSEKIVQAPGAQGFIDPLNEWIFNGELLQ